MIENSDQKYRKAWKKAGHLNIVTYTSCQKSTFIFSHEFKLFEVEWCYFIHFSFASDVSQRLTFFVAAK